MPNKTKSQPRPETEKLYMIQRADSLVFYSRQQGEVQFVEEALVKFKSAQRAGDLYDAARAKRLRFFI